MPSIVTPRVRSSSSATLSPTLGPRSAPSPRTFVSLASARSLSSGGAGGGGSGSASPAFGPGAAPALGSSSGGVTPRVGALLPPQLSSRSLSGAATPRGTPRSAAGGAEGAPAGGGFVTRAVVALAFVAGLLGPRPADLFSRAPSPSASLGARFRGGWEALRRGAAGGGGPPARRLNASAAGLLDDWDEPGFEDPSGTCAEYALFVPSFRARLRWWHRGALTSDDVTRLFYGAWERYSPLGPDSPGGVGGGGGGTRDPHFPATLESRVQLIGGAAYYARNPAGTAHLYRAPDVARQVVGLLPWAAERGIVLPDVDLAFNVLDRPSFLAPMPAPAPPHGLSAGPMHADVPIPDFTFARWPLENGVGEERRMDYAELIAAVLAAGDHAARPYASRERRALFRGTLGPASLERHAVADLAAPPNGTGVGLLDFGTWGGGAALPLRDFSAFAVQLAIPGYGWQPRLKYLLATGSPVVVLVGGHDNAFEEWWYPRLVPFVHYWPIRNIAEELLPAVRHLLDHPDQAAAIGAAGREFVAAHLRPDDVRCYWAYYLTYLSGLFAPGGVARHPSTVPVPGDVTADEFEELYDRDWPGAGSSGLRHRTAPPASARSAAATSTTALVQDT